MKKLNSLRTFQAIKIDKEGTFFTSPEYDITLAGNIISISKGDKTVFLSVFNASYWTQEEVGEIKNDTIKSNASQTNSKGTKSKTKKKRSTVAKS